MSLTKSGLQAALAKMMKDSVDQKFTVDQVAEAMATAIDDYVRQATVTGIRVSLPNGKHAAQTAPVTVS
jgi:hypothetical protein